MEQIRLPLNGVIVGHIQSVRPHPNADRLTLCDVDLGDGTPQQIVCGAPNVAEHQRVAVACVGSELTIQDKPVKIRKTKIRGQESLGMICAEDELGLSDDHQGIMVLTKSSTIGEPLTDYLRRESGIAEDTVLDLAITPNRPDATSHLGVARDLSALQNVPMKLPDVRLPAEGADAAREIEIQIQCPDLCRRYTVVMIRDVKIGPSPLWLKRRLESVGLRCINNIVDVTNFVMFECGQPLHAFDYDNIAQQKILVRESVTGEEFITLDGKQHTFTEGVILICDGDQPVAIGGVMGGQNSEVSSSTTNVLIESAWFEPSRTRRTAKNLGISTDASYRFERGVDTELQPWAAMRAAQLMVSLAGGSIVEGMVDVYPHPTPRTVLELRISRIEKILGLQIALSRIIEILTSLGFEPTQTAEDLITCTIPSYRPDINLEVDLIEEVVRIYGLAKIDSPKHSAVQLSVPVPRPADQAREKTHGFLIGHGYREIYTNSLLPDELALRFSQEVIGTDYPPARTLNAVSQSMATLRPSLLPGMLMVMQRNANHAQRVLRFYEFGHVFHRSEHEATFIENYSEYDALLLGISGTVEPVSWDLNPRMTDFFDLKGDVGQLLDTLQLDGLRMQPSHESTEITEYHITLYADQTRVGTIAKLSETVQASFDLPDPVFFAEFNWTRLILLYEKILDPRFVSISLFPTVERDLAVSVDRIQPVEPMIATLQKAGQPLLKDVDVFDVYTGDQISSNQKSVAFALRFGADRTLRDAEIDSVMGTIVNALSEQFGSNLRT